MGRREEEMLHRQIQEKQELARHAMALQARERASAQIQQRYEMMQFELYKEVYARLVTAKVLALAEGEELNLAPMIQVAGQAAQFAIQVWVNQANPEPDTRTMHDKPKEETNGPGILLPDSVKEEGEPTKEYVNQD